MDGSPYAIDPADVTISGKTATPIAGIPATYQGRWAFMDNQGTIVTDESQATSKQTLQVGSWGFSLKDENRTSTTGNSTDSQWKTADDDPFTLLKFTKVSDNDYTVYISSATISDMGAMEKGAMDAAAADSVMKTQYSDFITYMDNDWTTPPPNTIDSWGNMSAFDKVYNLEWWYAETKVTKDDNNGQGYSDAAWAKVNDKVNELIDAVDQCNVWKFALKDSSNFSIIVSKLDVALSTDGKTLTVTYYIKTGDQSRYVPKSDWNADNPDDAFTGFTKGTGSYIIPFTKQ
jgi:hypothetical protein